MPLCTCPGKHRVAALVLEGHEVEVRQEKCQARLQAEMAECAGHGSAGGAPQGVHEGVCKHRLRAAEISALAAERAAAEEVIPDCCRPAADEVRAAALEATAAAAAEREALEATLLAQRRVRLKLKGRFHAAVRSRAVASAPEPPLRLRLPAPGCRLLEGALPEWEVSDGLAHRSSLSLLMLRIRE